MGKNYKLNILGKIKKFKVSGRINKFNDTSNNYELDSYLMALIYNIWLFKSIEMAPVFKKKELVSSNY